MLEKQSNEKDAVRYWISIGSEITGAAIGGSMGFLTAGPVGGALAGALGVVISKGLGKLLSDFADRSLSKKEKDRIGTTVYFALEKIEIYLNCGRVPRSDGFFEANDHKRPYSEEILEGVLLKSRDEHEEKKLKILGNIFANIAFSEISLTESNYILKITDILTYSQICILALINQEKTLDVKDYFYYGWLEKNPIKNGFSDEKQCFLQQLYEMYNLGLLEWTKQDRRKPNEQKKLFLDALGKRYCKLANLEEVSQEDIEYVKKKIFHINFAPLCRIVFEISENG
ncbi:hypothetical protein [Nostoc cycadae]|uniref:Uncharacterized protein n=1 Tax=Nostoc cycadae WK-1 TaxID=1861711 RepID=A0A2H6LBS9_9NOSO|nr:hypothetical protein [Nostoc cycadae]GBE90642.1 hypothetical protein NCWK1_0361 [Nostoc cycadae WK-1]